MEKPTPSEEYYVPNHPISRYQILRSGGLLFFTLFFPTLYALTGNSLIRMAVMLEAFVIIAPTIILAAANGTLVAIAMAKSKVGGRMTSVGLIAIAGWVAKTPASMLGPRYPHFHVVAALYACGAAALLGIFCAGPVLDIFDLFHIIRTRENLTWRWPSNRGNSHTPSSSVVVPARSRTQFFTPGGTPSR